MRASARRRAASGDAGQGALPLSVRITDKLVDMLIAASEVQADVNER
jgi:hypothetical protein